MELDCLNTILVLFFLLFNYKTSKFLCLSFLSFFFHSLLSKLQSFSIILFTFLPMIIKSTRGVAVKIIKIVKLIITNHFLVHFSESLNSTSLILVNRKLIQISKKNFFEFNDPAWDCDLIFYMICKRF